MSLPERYQSVPHYQIDAVETEAQQQNAGYSYEQFQKVPFVQAVDVEQQQYETSTPEKVPNAQFEALHAKDMVRISFLGFGFFITTAHSWATPLSKGTSTLSLRPSTICRTL